MGDQFKAVGSRIHIDGGIVKGLDAYFGTTVNLSNGQIRSLYAHGGSKATISGGKVDYLYALEEADVTLSGGWGDPLFYAASGSSVDFVGTEFAINGMPIMNLVEGDRFEISERNNSTLTGVLTDGTRISLILDEGDGDFGLIFGVSDEAKITVTLIPEPSSLWLAATSIAFLSLRLRKSRRAL